MDRYQTVAEVGWGAGAQHAQLERVTVPLGPCPVAGAVVHNTRTPLPKRIQQVSDAVATTVKETCAVGVVYDASPRPPVEHSCSCRCRKQAMVVVEAVGR
jgi:hypothetical protein